jgi:membrane protease YdiL (CAAX protease family)
MKWGSASGTQIAFFSLALLLLVVPLGTWIKGLYPWSAEAWALVRVGLPFVLAATVLAGIEPLRRICRAELARPVPAAYRTEVAWVSVATLSIAFAYAGAWVLWWWLAEGPVSVEQRIRMLDSHDAHMARLAAPSEWVRAVLVVGFIGPVIEELVFRRFLYRAWERRWGWIVSTLLTSALFAAYHANAFTPFAMSVVCVCLYRRTGTLRAPIAAHAVYNLAAFHPLLGQLHFPRDGAPSGDLGAWGFHLACLLFVAMALPLYAWMSRDEPLPQ